MRNTLLMLAIPAALALAACGQDTTPPAPRTDAAAGTPVANQTTVPPAHPDRDTPPASPPATHDAPPQPQAPATSTAQDSAAQRPLDDLSKAEENTALPKPGQVNNHSTTAMDKRNEKGTPTGDQAPAK